MSESNGLDNGQLTPLRSLPSRRGTAEFTWTLPESWVVIVRELQVKVGSLMGEVEDLRKELEELKAWKKEYEPWVEKAKRRLEGRKE